jgi:hypothetical protein
MRFKNFTYKKKKDGETKNYLVLVLHETDTHFEGIDLTKLEEDEIKVLVEIQKEYETQLRPFVQKAYRKYIKENLVDANDTSDPQQQFDPK